MVQKKQESNWFVKNIFSIISLLIVIGGFIAGYVRLQVAVENMQKKTMDKEVIRQVTKEVFKEQIIPLQKDIQYIQTDIKRNQEAIGRLYRISATMSNSLKNK